MLLSLFLSLACSAPAVAEQGRIKAIEELRALAPAGFAAAPPVPAAWVLAGEASSGEDCPRRGRLLPETATAEVVSISDAFGYEFMRDFVLEAARAQPDSVPVFLLNAKPESVERLRRELDDGTRRGRRLAKRLRALEATSPDEFGRDTPLRFEWQQDFYKPRFDPGTGRPVAALISNYPDIGTLPEALARELSDLGIKTTRSPNQSAANGFSGGNIDMLPGGVCAIGDSDLKSAEREAFATSMCGEDASPLAAPTSWLRSGHIDELLRVVANPLEAGCAYSVLLASPRKALKLLRENPGSPAFAGLRGLPADPGYRISRIGGLNWVCATYQAMNAGAGSARALQSRPEK